MSRGTIAAHGRRYAIPRLAWSGVLYATNDDRSRAEAMVRLVAGVVLLVAFLKELCPCDVALVTRRAGK